MQNQSSEIYNVMTATPSPKQNGRPRTNGFSLTPNRSDSFNRLFGATPDKQSPRRINKLNNGSESKYQFYSNHSQICFILSFALRKGRKERKDTLIFRYLSYTKKIDSIICAIQYSSYY